MTHLTSFLPSLCRLGLEAFFPFSFLDRVAPRASLTKSHRLLATQHVNSDRSLLRRQSSKPGMRHALSARNIAAAELLTSRWGRWSRGSYREGKHLIVSAEIVWPNLQGAVN